MLKLGKKTLVHEAVNQNICNEGRVYKINLSPQLKPKYVFEFGNNLKKNFLMSTQSSDITKGISEKIKEL